jgi:DNA-binding CsgD family transcriptional regulator
VTLERAAYMPQFLRSLADATQQGAALWWWDQASERGRSARVDAFLADAAAHGLASGIAFGVRDLRAGLVLIALNSSNRTINDARHSKISRDLGDIMLLGIYFHEIFMSGLVRQGVAPRSEGAPLTPREHQCLMHAARGLTSADIGLKLDIAERTVEFHFAGIRSVMSNK